MRYIRAISFFFIVTLLISGCLWNKKPSPDSRPQALTKFFESNKYSLIYPLDSSPEPGAIYEETISKGLGRPLAYRESCTENLTLNSGEISFGEYTSSTESGIDFLLGLSQKLFPVKATIEGAFEKEVSYTVSSDLMPTMDCDWVTLRRACIQAIAANKDCRDALMHENAVVLSKVVSAKKFTFKFNGLKSGGIDAILGGFVSAGLKAKKKDKNSIVLEYDKPMKLCYQRYTPEELRIMPYLEDEITPLPTAKAKTTTTDASGLEGETKTTPLSTTEAKTTTTTTTTTTVASDLKGETKTNTLPGAELEVLNQLVKPTGPNEFTRKFFGIEE